MNDNQKISIVLPVYNGEKYLRNSIESCISQTYQNWELIIVNDCSTDRTLQIIEKFVLKDKRIQLVNNKTNLKLPSSLNEGFHRAKGAFWTWTSDDNMYMPNALEEMLVCLQNNKEYGMVYANFTSIDVNGKECGEINLPCPSELCIENTVGACFLYRREVGLAVGQYNPSLFLIEDYDYWVRIYKKYKIKKLSKTLYWYRKHDSSLTSTKLDFIVRYSLRLQIANFPFFYFKLSTLELRLKLMSSMIRRAKKGQKVLLFLVFCMINPLFFGHLIHKRIDKR